MTSQLSPFPPIEAKPVARLLDDAVAAFAGRPCLDFYGKRTSYGEVGALVDRAARGFQMLGVRKGVRVGLCLPNTPYFVICYYAVLKAGGTVVNYNPLYVERELRHQIADSQTVIMVTLDVKQIYPKVAAMLEVTCLERVVICSMSELLTPVKSLLFSALKRSEIADPPRDLRHVSFRDLIDNDGRVRPVAIDPGTDLAVLQYTGGTTGTPKGAMLTHANLSANTEQIRRRIAKIPLDREKMLGVLPLFHVFAMTCVMNFGISIGAELLLVPRFDIKDMMKLIARKRPTLFPGVPTIFTAINAAAETGRSDLSALKFCISGGAPLPLEVRQRFESLSGCTLIEGYGLSEASPVVATNIPGQPIKPGSIGRPVEGTILEIRSTVDPGQVLGRDEKGEVCVRGPQVMAGYWNKAEETAAVFVDGALRTGDVGYVDGEGDVFLVDRIKDVILCGGYNVYPRVIEEALYQHPAVAEAVVVGIPDAYRGQAPKAFVRLREGAEETTVEELRRYLGTQISRIEMPKEIEFRSQLPKTMIGKLSKKELIDEERARAARQG